jgi:hypothetical protein
MSVVARTPPALCSEASSSGGDPAAAVGDLEAGLYFPDGDAVGIEWELHIKRLTATRPRSLT